MYRYTELDIENCATNFLIYSKSSNTYLFTKYITLFEITLFESILWCLWKVTLYWGIALSYLQYRIFWDQKVNHTIVNSHYLNTALFEDLLYDQYLFPLVRCDQLINCYQFHKEILILSFFFTMSLLKYVYVYFLKNPDSLCNTSQELSRRGYER